MFTNKSGWNLLTQILMQISNFENNPHWNCTAVDFHYSWLSHCVNSNCSEVMMIKMVSLLGDNLNEWGDLPCKWGTQFDCTQILHLQTWSRRQIILAHYCKSFSNILVYLKTGTSCQCDCDHHRDPIQNDSYIQNHTCETMLLKTLFHIID